MNRFKFTSIQINNYSPRLDIYYYNPNVVGKKLSCFLTDLKYIICFYTYRNTDENSIYGYIKIISQDFSNLGGIDVKDVYYEDTSFLKCIKYKEEVVIFIYYNYIYD